MSVPILTAAPDIGQSVVRPGTEPEAQGEFSRMLNDELHVDDTATIDDAASIDDAGIDDVATQVEDAVELFDPTTALIEEVSAQVEPEAVVLDPTVVALTLPSGASAADVVDVPLAELNGTRREADQVTGAAELDAATDDPLITSTVGLLAESRAVAPAGVEVTVDTQVATDDVSVAADVAMATGVSATEIGATPVEGDTQIDAELAGLDAPGAAVDSDPSAAADLIGSDAVAGTDVATPAQAASSETDGAATLGATDGAADDGAVADADAATSMQQTTAAENSGRASADVSTTATTATTAEGASPLAATGALSTASGPTAPPVGVAGSPTGPDAMVETTLSRIAETIEAMSAQPPPRSISLDLSELHGIRVRISIDAGEISVDVSDAGAGSSGSDHWQRQLQDSLHERRRGGRRFGDDASAPTAATATASTSTTERTDRGLRL